MTAQSALTLRLPTPERVELHFAVAPALPRVLAFGLDVFVILGLILGISMLLSLSGLAMMGVGGGGLAGALINVVIFVVMNFYFVLSELRWQGRTLGKRAFGLRVVARDGGPLGAWMIFARNLTRDLEFLLPLLIAASGGTLLGIDDGWVRLIAVGWTLVVLLLPLTNRHRARVGDLLGGTVVVLQPRPRLLEDLASDRAGATMLFTPAQLAIYGVRELQTLEEVLRRAPESQDLALVVEVAERVKRRIGWDRARWQVDPLAFLHAFYAAQRQRLEAEMLLGRRREAREGAPPAP